MNKLIMMTRDEAYRQKLIVDCTEIMRTGGVTIETSFAGTKSIATSDLLAKYFAMIQNTTNISVEKLHHNMGIAFISKFLKMKQQGIPRLRNELYFEMIIEADLATRVIPLKAYSHMDGLETCLTFTMEHEQWN